MAREMRDSERSVFALHGFVGMLVATVLLLSILAGLAIISLTVQQMKLQMSIKLMILIIFKRTVAIITKIINLSNRT